MPPFGSLFFLVIEHTVAVALEIGVFYLLTELSAHALVFLGLLTAARTVTACAPKPLLHGIHNLFIGIESYLHFQNSFLRLLLNLSRVGGILHSFAASLHQFLVHRDKLFL